MVKSDETKGFIYGFIATVAAGLVTLVIFQKYIAEKAAEIALENYTQRYGLMRTPKTMSPLTTRTISIPESPATRLNRMSSTPTDEATLNKYGMI